MRSKNCPSCEGTGSVGVVTVDYPGAPVVPVKCKGCSGYGSIYPHEALAYMTALRGSIGKRDASRALGWKSWMWADIERGARPIAHLLMYRYGSERPGWPSVRAALAVWRGRPRVLVGVAS